MDMHGFAKTSHCSWDRGDQTIVKQYCPRQGGVVFKLFDGNNVTSCADLASAITKANEAVNV